jgi:hypothetical protein
MRFFGLRAARRSWNGKAWVYFVPKGNYTPVTIAAKLNLDDQGRVPYGSYLAIKQQDDIVYPFTPGQDSILADDWYLLD